jgi:hypothetical protein
MQMLRDMMRPPSTQKSPSKAELSRARRRCCSKTPFVFSRFLVGPLSLSAQPPYSKGWQPVFFLKDFLLVAKSGYHPLEAAFFYFFCCGEFSPFGDYFSNNNFLSNIPFLTKKIVKKKLKKK